MYLLAAVFLVQGAIRAGLNLEEKIPTSFPVERFPTQLGSWEMYGEEPLDEPTRALLQPDASIIRGYRNSPSGLAGSIFVGYFKSTQANHPTPHSPTVCLPGAGWTNVYQREIELPSSGDTPFVLNEYVLEKGASRLVVLYWYQNLKRTWAREVLAKVYMLPDFVRERRTDVVIVRLTFSTDQSHYQAALAEGKSLAAATHPEIAKLFTQSALELR
jgi:EpsI family protein